jgi:hypothetical protein
MWMRGCMDASMFVCVCVHVHVHVCVCGLEGGLV